MKHFTTWHFIATHPGVFAVAVPLSGAGDTDLAKNMVGIPVWAFPGVNRQERSS